MSLFSYVSFDLTCLKCPVPLSPPHSQPVLHHTRLIIDSLTHWSRFETMSESFEEEPEKPTQKSSIGGSSEYGGAEGITPSSNNMIAAIADDQAVKLSKILVFLVIGITAIAFAAVTYIFTKNEETNEFEIQ